MKGHTAVCLILFGAAACSSGPAADPDAACQGNWIQTNWSLQAANCAFGAQVDLTTPGYTQVTSGTGWEVCSRSGTCQSMTIECPDSGRMVLSLEAQPAHGEVTIGACQWSATFCLGRADHIAGCR